MTEQKINDYCYCNSTKEEFTVCPARGECEDVCCEHCIATECDWLNFDDDDYEYKEARKWQR